MPLLARAFSATSRVRPAQLQETQTVLRALPSTTYLERAPVFLATLIVMDVGVLLGPNAMPAKLAR